MQGCGSPLISTPGDLIPAARVTNLSLPASLIVAFAVDASALALR
ncbi:hypothetical protein I551_5506 [Mycobacterium ulcerans str. Harvey]|uniref:Uncharacterized protein n=1 Tax=Mycobacterium ulcerans str. Harvey TaxID=1299332 RepID=A0ABN0QTL9_MYCUL|nr:hypothetical protein I551_5506 [Mycobacterium ulcerans str. Harvey]